MRARNIKPGFFVSDQVAENSYEGRLLFIGLWLMADCNGNLENRPRKMKAIIFPFDNIEIEPLLINLDKSGLIRTYTVQGQSYINIPKFLKHQTPHKNERETGGKFPNYTSEAEEPHSIAESRIIQNNPDKSRKNQSNPADLLNPESGILNPDLLNEDIPPERLKVIAEKIPALFFEICIDDKKRKKKPALTDKRAKHIKARIKEDDTRNNLDFWKDYFQMVAESDFLSGRKTEWTVTFDWLLNPTNMAKVLEGNYLNNQQITQATKKPETPKGEPIKTEPLYNPFTDPNFGKGTGTPKNTIELKDGEYERL